MSKQVTTDEYKKYTKRIKPMMKNACVNFIQIPFAL